MNQYLLAMYPGGRRNPDTAPSPEDVQAFMGRVIALEAEMDRAGVFVFGGSLHGPDASTVVAGGSGLDRVITDGPFVEAKDHIGGFYVINAEDLDEAVRWADRVADTIQHDIEVRPFQATGRMQDQMGH